MSLSFYAVLLEIFLVLDKIENGQNIPLWPTTVPGYSISLANIAQTSKYKTCFCIDNEASYCEDTFRFSETFLSMHSAWGRLSKQQWKANWQLTRSNSISRGVFQSLWCVRICVPDAEIQIYRCKGADLNKAATRPRLTLVLLSTKPIMELAKLNSQF